MGLSVSIYTNVKHCPNPEDSDFTAYVLDKSWEHKIKNLNKGADYNGEQAYRAADYAYSTHSRFREYLVSLTGVKGVLDSNGEIIWSNLPSDMPFIDLIDFADNEGCFDWETASRLLCDFDKFAEKNNINTNEYMAGKYKTWHEGMRIASSSKGVTVFS